MQIHVDRESIRCVFCEYKTVTISMRTKDFEYRITSNTYFQPHYERTGVSISHQQPQLEHKRKSSGSYLMGEILSIRRRKKIFHL